ncbi:MAG: hypothetical protein IJB43_00510 [Clostridia bacterium]|nr:hypothetical protein [Clostridia bacterium]
MKKTLLALALSLIMIVSLALTVYASNTISYTVQSTTAGRGDTVELVVAANNATQVKSMGIKISYNKEALEYVSSEWTLPAGYMMATPWTETQDAAALYMAPTNVSGNIFKMKFKVKDTAALDSVAAVNVTVVAKNGSTTFPSNMVQNGSIAISCPHTNTEPRAEVPAGCNVPGLTAGVYCLGCQKYISGGQATNPTGNHTDADGKWETDGDKHWHTCSCGQIFDEATHTGGTATCVDKAVCGVCAKEYGTINAENHKVSTEKLAEDKYLVAGTGVNCKDAKKYYYECLKCHNATAEIWTSDKTGEHAYGELVQAKVEVHTPEKLEPAVAAHHLCSVCQTYFTEGKVATTLQALTGATPVHTFGDAYKSDAEKHWKECSCGLKNSEGAHIYDGASDMICNTCQYDRSCTHSKPLTHVEAKPANCTDSGNIEYWYCVDCLAKFDAATAATATKLTDVTVPALGHIFDTKYTYADGYHWNACTGIGCTETTAKVACDSAVKATCQQKAVCDTCGNTYTDFAPHDYATEYTTEAGKHWRACKTVGCTAVTDEANCSGGTATCYKLAVCATCQKEYGTLAAHVISTDWNYKDATGHAHACTNTGCTYHETIQPHVDDAAGESCTVCGHIYHTCGANETTYVAPVIGNCMVKGRQAYYRCSCGKLYYDDAATTVLNSLSDIEAYGAHSGVVTPAVPATCTTPGTTEAMVCSVCRMQFSIAQVIPATGHSFGEWTTTLEPTEYAEGSKSRTCSACNEVETEAIPALGHEHTAVEIPAVAPTCTETGLTAGSKCATCGEILVAQETVPAIDHASVTHVGANAATSTEAGNVEHWICSECETVWLDEERTTVATKEDVVIPVIPETEPEETTQAPEETTEAPEETTVAPEETTEAPEETTAAPEETTAAPEETTAAPEETTQAPEDITVPEETTEAPVETTEAPEETTAAPEETTSPEVPSTGDSAIFFIVALIAFSAIFAFAVALGKKRTEN